MAINTPVEETFFVRKRHAIKHAVRKLFEALSYAVDHFIVGPKKFAN